MSRLGKGTQALADLVRLNAHYLSSGSQRSAFRSVLHRSDLPRHRRKIVEAELAAAPPTAAAYANLLDVSLTLAGIRTSSARPHLNLLITEIRPGAVFAGIHTAVKAAVEFGRQLDRPIRVVMLDFTSAGNTRSAVANYLSTEFGIPAAVILRESIRDTTFGDCDIWLATHSKTAHAMQVITDIGLVRPDQVAYLIQDYEPGFTAWSTNSVVAAATYHAGFVPIVNSTPLARFLEVMEDVRVEPDLVFAPEFELERLAVAASTRVTRDEVNVLFYGRPSKHRNLYGLGLAALRATALQLDAADVPVTFQTAGEKHPSVKLSERFTLTSLGRLPWANYFDLLSSTDVVLSLQQSPHPSHPPFDAAIAGATAITNEFYGTRGGLHPRIVAVPASPAELSHALASAIKAAHGAQPRPFLPVADGALGGTLGAAVACALQRLHAS